MHIWTLTFFRKHHLHYEELLRYVCYVNYYVCELKVITIASNCFNIVCSYNVLKQGRIEPSEAARGHATS